jgi:hypothetical protein
MSLFISIAWVAVLAASYLLAVGLLKKTDLY